MSKENYVLFFSPMLNMNSLCIQWCSLKKFLDWDSFKMIQIQLCQFVGRLISQSGKGNCWRWNSVFGFCNAGCFQLISIYFLGSVTKTAYHLYENSSILFFDIETAYA